MYLVGTPKYWRVKRAYRAITLISALIVISACGGGYDSPSRNVPTPNLTKVDASGQIITLAPPVGFCLDNESAQETEHSTYLLFKPCPTSRLMNISRSRRNSTAILTATVSKAVFSDTPETSEQLSDFIKSDAGKSLIGSSGNPSDVVISSVRTQENVLVVNATDNSPKVIQEKSNQVWRGFFGVSDRMVSLSVITLGKAETGLVSEETLMRFARQTKQANQISETHVSSETASTIQLAPVEPIQPITLQRPNVDNKPQQSELKNVGFLRRLLF